MKTKSSRILLIGHFGRNNIGDQLMLDSQISLLAGHNIIVASNEQINNIKTIRDSIIPIFISMRKVDYICFGGGTFIHDHHQNIKFKYSGHLKILIYFLLSKILKKKFNLVGNGFYPIKKSITKIVLKFIINNSNYCSVRDKSSFNELCKIKGLDKDKIQLTSDSALIKLHESILISKLEKTNYIIGINILPYYNIYENKPNLDNIFIDRLSIFIEELCKKISYLNPIIQPIIFNNKKTENETELISKFNNQLSSSITISDTVFLNNTEDVINTFPKFSLYIGMRYHGILFSRVFNVKQIIISYHPKCSVLGNELNVDDDFILTLENISLTNEKMDKLLNELNSPYNFNRDIELIHKFFFPDMN
ncbi:MAG: polysaccharide pyruvyl transferase family protein [Prolixibacteraceae bacterium]